MTWRRSFNGTTRAPSLKGHWTTVASWCVIPMVCDVSIALSDYDKDWRRHLELLYLTGRYNQLVVFYRESARRSLFICRKGIDGTCVDYLKESVYYVKALVSVSG